ncbi:DUF2510 domain-containing protein [Streptomyces laculatispora]|uniref:DUF2510 domain-containing protein n=1 Tax=Streptomyces laculatispora TaxID=887464 RepID=A0ABY9IB30_9ACTN|nr:DUF2510 domain-containing protein [Streptomyces laculatispora]WLQ44108.1 DUF2510 domain-containing protein [Streptomyces laculatispora]
MSNATPPGWYPDTAAPGNERWWDGTAWTAHTRPCAPATQQSGPVRPAAPAGPGGGGSGRIIALVVAGAVVVGAAVTGAVLRGRDDGGKRPQARSSSAAPPPAATGTDGTPDDSPSPDDGDPTVLVDQLNGITLPIPDGWEKPDSTVEQMLTMRTTGSYNCPGSSSDSCYHGTVTTRTPNAGDAGSAEELAKDDIADAAKGAYGENAVGTRIHRGITSHKQIAAASVSVTGRTGYQVRWRVVTGKGPGGYAQSLVFPSTVGSESLVVVRYAFDAGPDGPPLSLMDTLTKGIRPIGDSETSGGVGSSVAP